MALDQPIPSRGISYRSSLIVSVSLLVLITGLVLTLFAFRGSRRNTEALAGSLFREATGHVVTKTRAYVQRATPLAKSLCGLASDGTLALDDSDRLARQLTDILRANPGIDWISYGDDSGTFTGAARTPEGKLRINQSRIGADGKTILDEHDVLDDGSLKIYRHLDDSGYDPRKRPYYSAARDAKELVWLKPYVFYGQGIPGISCACPVYGDADKLRGVVTVDFNLNTLSEFVSQISLGPNSRMMIFTPDGALLAHPNAHVKTQAYARGDGNLVTVDSIDDPLAHAFYQQITPADRTTDAGGQRFRQFTFDFNHQRYYGSATAFQLDGGQVWIVGAMSPESDYLADVWKNNRASMAIALISLLAAMALAALLARRVSKPIVSLMSFMGKVGAGDLDAKANFGGNTEFQNLSTALNKMIVDLREAMRLRHSVAVAMEVQQKLLPASAPKVPGLDIVGHSTYCDETGGDYFDYLVLDQPSPGTLLAVVGDVMGHGVAAALLMAGARGVLRSHATTDGRLSALLTHLNELLLHDTGGDRFMTMCVATIDSIARTVRWASAGHDAPIVYDPATDSFTELQGGDVPLGVLDGVNYDEYTSPALAAGSVITIGTDGVWEMANPAGEMFGKERLRQVIRAASGKNATARDIVTAINRALKEFRGPARQMDDVTYVVIRLTDAAPVHAN